MNPRYRSPGWVSRELEKFYGKDWKTMNLDKSTGKNYSKGHIKGGDDGLVDTPTIETKDIDPDPILDVHIEDPSELEIDISDLEKQDDINIFDNTLLEELPKKPTKEPEKPEKQTKDAKLKEMPKQPDFQTSSEVPQFESVRDESPESQESRESQEIQDIDTVDIFGESNVKEHRQNIGKLYITNTMIYQEDRISEFKEKIYVATGIAPCKQHLYYISQRMAYPMSYQLVAESRIITDIRELYISDSPDSTSSVIEGIPIDSFLYKIRDNLKIYPFDHFKTIGQLYSKHDQNTYYVFDLDDFINPIKSKLSETLNDKFQMEMFYYGFIVKYWPMITFEAFPDFLKGTELEDKYPDLTPSQEILQKKYEVEQKTVDALYTIPLDTIKDNSEKLYKMSITSAILNVDVNRYGFKMKLNIRNIFDRFVLDK